jgi:hypothetical protein
MERISYSCLPLILIPTISTLMLPDYTRNITRETWFKVLSEIRNFITPGFSQNTMVCFLLRLLLTYFNQNIFSTCRYANEENPHISYHRLDICKQQCLHAGLSKLPHVCVVADMVWISNWVYWILEIRKYR